MANTSELTADLLEQAERTRRLSIAIRSDLNANWLDRIAIELDAAIRRRLESGNGLV